MVDAPTVSTASGTTCIETLQEEKSIKSAESPKEKMKKMLCSSSSCQSLEANETRCVMQVQARVKDRTIGKKEQAKEEIPSVISVVANPASVLNSKDLNVKKGGSSTCQDASTIATSSNSTCTAEDDTCTMLVPPCHRAKPKKELKTKDLGDKGHSKSKILRKVKGLSATSKKSEKRKPKPGSGTRAANEKMDPRAASTKKSTPAPRVHRSTNKQKGLLRAAKKKSTLVARVETLVRSYEKDMYRLDNNTMSKTRPSSNTTSKNRKSNMRENGRIGGSATTACDRLYQQSTRLQEEGKRRRKAIAKASAEAKEMPDFSDWTIPVSQAGAFYDRNMKYLLEREERLYVSRCDALNHSNALLRCERILEEAGASAGYYRNIMETVKKIVEKESAGSQTDYVNSYDWE